MKAKLTQPELGLMLRIVAAKQGLTVERGEDLKLAEALEAKGAVTRVGQTFKRRNPLKDPRPGDSFQMRPTWPDGKPRSWYQITIQTRTEPGKQRYTYWIRKGSAFFSYSLSHTPGVTFNLEVGGMVAKLKRENAEVLE